jgi:DNA-binding CsgD family transcriptional regulator
MSEPPRPAELPLSAPGGTFVGRDDELAQIVSALRDSGHGSFVIAGQAGIGKSRLAAEAARQASLFGYDVAHLVATNSTSGIAFGAFAPFLSSADSPSATPAILLQELARSIVRRIGTSARPLLVVDDVQHLDDMSAALVLQLAETKSCSLIATLRAPGAVPSAITALWKDAYAVRIDLAPLSADDVSELAAGILGGPVAASLVEWLWTATAGNALYVRELVLAGLQAQALENDGHTWVLSRPLHAGQRLTELIASRLADVSERALEVLDILAVAEPLGVSLIEAVAGSAGLEEAEQQGLVVIRDSGRRLLASLSHPVYADVLGEQLTRMRRRRLSAQLAAALEATGARRHEDEMRIGGWQLDAGIRGDPDLLTRAATTARERFDLELADRLAHAALDAGGGVEAGMAIAEAHFFSGRSEEAEAVLQGLEKLCSNDLEIARVADARTYNLGILLGRYDDALRVLDEALATVVAPEARFRLLNRRATTEVYTDAVDRALSDANELLESGEDRWVARGAYVASIGFAMTGRCTEAVTTAKLGMEAQRRSGDTSRRIEAHLLGSTIGHLGAGRLPKAEEDARRSYESGVAMGAKESIATGELLLGWVLIERGMVHQAATFFRDAVSINRELRDTSTLRFCLGGLALAEGMAGNAAAAERAFEDLEDVPRHWLDVFDPDLVERGKAWTLAASGATSEARAMLRDAASTARARRYPVAEARLLLDLCRLDEPARVSPRLEELAAAVDGELVEVYAYYAAAIEVREGDRLEMAAARLEGLGALLLAAEANALAAAKFREDGLYRSATSCERRFEQLSQECGNPRTPGVRQPHGLTPLSAREREVALMAAAGASNRDIASRLFISVRTVEAHLQRVYTKLGVAGRDSLAEALR